MFRACYFRYSFLHRTKYRETSICSDRNNTFDLKIESWNDNKWEYIYAAEPFLRDEGALTHTMLVCLSQYFYLASETRIDFLKALVILRCSVTKCAKMIPESMTCTGQFPCYIKLVNRTFPSLSAASLQSCSFR